MVEAPADIPDKAKKLAISIAQKAVGSLEGAGVFAVELFLTQDGKVCFKKSAFYFGFPYLFLVPEYAGSTDEGLPVSGLSW